MSKEWDEPELKARPKTKRKPIRRKPVAPETWDEMKDRHALEKAEAVMSLSEQGLTKTEAANALGLSPSRLCHYISENGLRWHTAPRHGFKSRDPESLSPFGVNNPPAGERMQ